VIAPAGALQAAVTNNSILAFGSSQSMSVATLVSGTGGVNQVGSGTTTLTGSSSYTGPTSMVDGKLAVANLPNGGGNSPLGASSSGAANWFSAGARCDTSGRAAAPIGSSPSPLRAALSTHPAAAR
jgi:fibronectin-binding autotransporter adhesin